MGFDDSCSATTTTTRVLDIQSDWQTTEDDSFWVSSSDRVVLTYPDPIAGAHVLVHGSTPTSMHTVHKADASTAGIPSSPYHIADQSRYSLTVATESYSMSFFTPHTQTPLQTQLYAVSTSPNGAFLGVGGADGLFHVLQVPTHTSLQLAGHVSDVTHVEFFPSSLVALTGSADFSLRIWSVQTFTCGAVLRGHKGAISGIGILGRGRNVVSCAQDRFVKLWHCGSSHCYRDWHLPSTPRCLVSSASHHDDHDQGRTLAEAPDMEFETSSTWLIVGTDAGVTALDARVASPVLQLGHAAAVTACATTHGSGIPMLVTGTEDGVLSTYDLRQPKGPIHMMSRSGAGVRAIEMADKAAWVATADGSCSRWSGLAMGQTPAVTGELVGPTYDAVNGLSVSSNGTLSSVSRDGVLRMYESPTS